jgi:hypothetical protein
VSNVDDPIGKLRSKISFHQSEALRLQTLLDAILREVSSRPGEVPLARPTGPTQPESADPSRRFVGLTFVAATRRLLRERGPLPASEITKALLAGGFETESENPARNFANMLDAAERRGQLSKTGDRSSGVLWLVTD